MSLAILIVTVIAVILLIKSRKEYRISYNLTLYQTGAALYIFNNYEKAASVLCKALNQSVTEDNEDLKAKVLYGLCMWEYSQITSDNVMMREAVLNLKTLHESKTYAELKKNGFEEMVYVSGAIALSTIYRTGITPMLPQDMSAAFSVLLQALDNLTCTKAVNYIVNELQHFHKFSDGPYYYAE